MAKAIAGVATGRTPEFIEMIRISGSARLFFAPVSFA